MAKKIEGLLRTHTCGELRQSDIGSKAILCGWVNRYRNLGNLHFIDIRDRYGVTQLGFEEFNEDIKNLKKIPLESVIQVEGEVRERPVEAHNKKMPTGIVEVQVKSLKVLSKSLEVPFLPHGKIQNVTEDLRLKYRYLDLRSERLQRILQRRSQTLGQTRNALRDFGFLEIDTPILYKTTPEGARDFIVPSRLNKGSVYALPQSPQTLKQLSMIGGLDKYFQMAKCFRDEDLRADRQPEFTQVDIEASFATEDYVKGLSCELAKTWFDLSSDYQLPEMTYEKAMEMYGSDKPDTRFGLYHHNITNLFKESEFTLLKDIAASGAPIKGLFFPKKYGELSRKIIDGIKEKLFTECRLGKDLIYTWFKISDGKRMGALSKNINDEQMSLLNKMTQENHYSSDEASGDGLWFVIGSMNPAHTHQATDFIRRFLGQEFSLHKEGFHLLWVKDFPLFEKNSQGHITPSHHPFTMVTDDDRQKFLEENDPEAILSCKAQAYDMVCNGYELGGGSLRIYEEKFQKRMFQILGLTEEDVAKKFGFFIEALKYGTPPHGGIAFGLDRIVMVQTGTDNIRDVIAFPKTSSGTDLMASSPSMPSDEQMKELYLKWDL